jgi:hypothetical protein
LRNTVRDQKIGKLSPLSSFIFLTLRDQTAALLWGDWDRQKERQMSITATPQQSHSRDVALAAIAQAQRQIGHADEQLVQLDETAFKLEKEKNAARHPSNEQPRSAEPGRGSSRGRLVLRSLMGLLAFLPASSPP